VIISPSVNLAASFAVPEFLYFTNNVSGSVPSVTTNPITSATTPDVPPVNVFALYSDNVPLKEVNLTANKNCQMIFDQE